MPFSTVFFGALKRGCQLDRLLYDCLYIICSIFIVIQWLTSLAYFSVARFRNTNIVLASVFSWQVKENIPINLKTIHKRYLNISRHNRHSVKLFPFFFLTQNNRAIEGWCRDLVFFDCERAAWSGQLDCFWAKRCAISIVFRMYIWHRKNKQCPNCDSVLIFRHDNLSSQSTPYHTGLTKLSSALLS